MQETPADFRTIGLEEIIDADDVFFINGKLTIVLPYMVGKTTYQASLAYFKNAENILSVFRVKELVKICSSSKIKVHVNYALDRS